VQSPPSETLGAADARPAAWPIRRQNIAIAAWSSFLAAALTSVLCFAFLDPAGIPGLAGASRLTGYTIGFFLFWFAAATASLLTLYLVRTARAGRPSAE
jgi:hypothetical protein